jgi:4a-hydroxytetrahydrobiopterin dehydratase
MADRTRFARYTVTVVSAACAPAAGADCSPSSAIGPPPSPPSCRVRSRTGRLVLEHARNAIGYASSGMDKPKILTSKELRSIMPRLSGWKLARNKLSRTFEFQDFVQSLSFVNSLVAYFETVDHHPDVYIAYGEVTFELTRYDVGGRVTDRDVEVAKKISSVYRARS